MVRFGRPKAPPYRPLADRTPTQPTPTVKAPTTQPIPLPSTYPHALPPHLEPTAELFTLHAQGRLGTTAVLDVLCSIGVWRGQLPPPLPVFVQAMGYLRAWESFYAPLMEGPCPQGMRCPEAGGLCAWHRKTLRRWFDRLHPVVRAAGDPATFAEAVAPLVGELPEGGS